MVTKIPPGPIVVIQKPPTRAITNIRIAISGLIERLFKKRNVLKKAIQFSLCEHSAENGLQNAFSGINRNIDREDHQSTVCNIQLPVIGFCTHQFFIVYCPE